MSNFASIASWKKLLLGTGLAVAINVALSIAHPPAAQAYYTTAQIQSWLQHGVTTAYNADSYCRSNFQNNINRGLSLREAINQGGSYIDDSWLSLRGRPNVTNPVDIEAGATSLPLQINTYSFICAPLVHPTFSGSGWSIANQILNDSSRWVAPNDARDRAPNNVGYSGMLPARTGSSMSVMSATVISGGGSITSVNPTTSAVYRDDWSRYWFGNNINLDYTSSPILSSKTITVQIRYKSIARYGSGTYQCINSSSQIVNVGSFWDYGVCETYTRNMTLSLNVPNGWNVNGQSYAYKDGITYKNYNNSQPDSYGATAHASEQPTVLSGELARFTSTLRNNRLGQRPRINANIHLSVENAFFPSYQAVQNCVNGDWNSCGTDNFTAVARGTAAGGGSSIAGQCPGVKYNSSAGITIAPDGLVTYDQSDNCTGMRVPSNGSRIGWYVCQRVSWFWRSTVDSTWGHATPACFMVKSTFDLVPQIGESFSTATGTVAPGTDIDAPSVIINGGGIVSGIDTNWGTYDFTIPRSIMSTFTEAQISSLFSAVFNKTSSGGVRYAEVDYNGAVATVCDWMRTQPELADKTQNCIPIAAQIVRIANPGSLVVNSDKLSTASAQVGDLVCRTLSIQHFNWDTRKSDNNARRIAYPRCYRIAKTPSVQIWGNDVRVGSNSGTVVGLPATEYTKSSILTAVNTITNATTDISYGSWGEYAMATPLQGVIQSSSAGGLSGYGSGKAPVSTQSAADRNRLSFANSGPGLGGSVYGRWGRISSQPNLGAQFTSNVQAHAGNFALGGLVSGTYQTSAAVTKISGEVGAGRSIIVKSSGTVIIDGDIRYANSSYSKPSDITQLVIIAQNVIIRDNVSHVDAWLVATANTSNTSGGVISTCETSDSPVLTDHYTDGLNASICNGALRINGPVLARELQLRRTFGAEPLPGDPTGSGYSRSAETISARADAYIWAANYLATANGNIATDYTVELPPRY